MAIVRPVPASIPISRTVPPDLLSGQINTIEDMGRAKSDKNIHKTQKHIIQKRDRSYKYMLKRPIFRLEATEEPKGSASNFKGREINLADVQTWDNFITPEDIERLWEETPGLN